MAGLKKILFQVLKRSFLGKALKQKEQDIMQMICCALENAPYENFHDPSQTQKYIPTIVSKQDTIRKIVQIKASISRFGDGEFHLMAQKGIPTQAQAKTLGERMEAILREGSSDNFFVCLPDVFGSLSVFTPYSQCFWRGVLHQYRKDLVEKLNPQSLYYDALLSRPYITFQDKNREVCQAYFTLLKSLWEKRDLVIIEGRNTGFGVDNDLLDNVKSLRRVLCPEKDAYAIYDRILAYACTLDKDALILLCLGPTATVMAYDLHKAGYQALDIGNLDTEYTWFLQGAEEKKAHKFNKNSLQYQKQIIKTF